MSEININGKALYSTKGAAREYGRIGCNFYTGCPNGCEYCYLKRGAPGRLLGGSEVRLKKCFKDELDAGDVLCRELDRWLEPCRKHGIFLSFTTDPLIEETRDLTTRAIIEAVMRDIPVYILTKDAAFVKDECDFMAWMEQIRLPYRDLVHFGFTLTGRDDMEPNASTNRERIMAMSELPVKGFPTFASIEPVIDWDSAERMVRESVTWCSHYKLGLRSGVKKDYYDVGESGAAIERIVKTCEAHGRTIYLKESIRKLLRRYFYPGAYEEFMSRTVGSDGKPYKEDNNGKD